jgi:spermidine/putrescine transport system ATP-binding protein
MTDTKPALARSGEPLLTFSGVEKRFDDVLAVKDFNLEIGRGDFVAIMGPSGCGKTTTLRMLAGLEHPTAGSIQMHGETISGRPPWLRRMPLVWQNYALFPFLTVLDNVGFGLRNENVGKAERTRRSLKWLERLGIAELAQRSPSTLSGGQAQRVALARALVLEPEVLLLDEPLSALDANMVVRMQTEISELQRSLGITFVYVTHNQSEAFAMADRVVIMNKGEIQQIGGPLEVYRAPRTRFVAEFVGTNNILDGIVVSRTADAYVVETKVGRFASSNPSNADTAEGGKVHLVVSADLVSIGKDSPADAENELVARLVGESFVGNVVTLVCEAHNGQEFKVQLQQRALQHLSLRTNEEVKLTFEARDTLVIPEAR